MRFCCIIQGRILKTGSWFVILYARTESCYGWKIIFPRDWRQGKSCLFLFPSFEKMGFRGILYRGDKDETRRKMCICLRSLLWCLSGISRWVPRLFVWFCPGCLQGVQKRFSEMCGRTSNHPLQRMSGISLRKIKKIQSGTNYWRHLQSRWCNSGFTIHKKSRRWAISALSGRKIHLQSMRRTSDLV